MLPSATRALNAIKYEEIFGSVQITGGQPVRNLHRLGFGSCKGGCPFSKFVSNLFSNSALIVGRMSGPHPRCVPNRRVSLVFSAALSRKC